MCNMRIVFDLSGCVFSAAGCGSSPSSLLHLCDLFLHGLASTSVSLRLEFDHLLRKAAQGLISIPLAAYRVASLLQQHPECSDKLGVLFRIFRDIKLQRLTATKRERRLLECPSKPGVQRPDAGITGENLDERQKSAQKRRRLEQEQQGCLEATEPSSGYPTECRVVSCYVVTYWEHENLKFALLHQQRCMSVIDLNGALPTDTAVAGFLQ